MLIVSFIRGLFSVCLCCMSLSLKYRGEKLSVMSIGVYSLCTSISNLVRFLGVVMVSIMVLRKRYIIILMLLIVR